MKIKVNSKVSDAIKKEILAGRLTIKEVTDENICDVFDYFEMLEISLSTQQDHGEDIDQEWFDTVCQVVDELNVQNDDTIDVDDLNNQLGLI